MAVVYIGAMTFHFNKDIFVIGILGKTQMRRNAFQNIQSVEINQVFVRRIQSFPRKASIHQTGSFPLLSPGLLYCSSSKIANVGACSSPTTV